MVGRLERGCSVVADGVCVDVIMVRTWIPVWALSWLGRGCKGNTGGFGTASKGKAVNTDGFGTCRIPPFGREGNTDGTDIFGT